MTFCTAEVSVNTGFTFGAISLSVLTKLPCCIPALQCSRKPGTPKEHSPGSYR